MKNATTQWRVLEKKRFEQVYNWINCVQCYHAHSLFLSALQCGIIYLLFVWSDGRLLPLSSSARAPLVSRRGPFHGPLLHLFPTQHPRFECTPGIQRWQECARGPGGAIEMLGYIRRAEREREDRPTTTEALSVWRSSPLTGEGSFRVTGALWSALWSLDISLFSFPFICSAHHLFLCLNVTGESLPANCRKVSNRSKHTHPVNRRGLPLMSACAWERDSVSLVWRVWWVVCACMCVCKYVLLSLIPYNRVAMCTENIYYLWSYKKLPWLAAHSSSWMLPVAWLEMSYLLCSAKGFSSWIVTGLLLANTVPSTFCHIYLFCALVASFSSVHSQHSLEEKLWYPLFQLRHWGTRSKYSNNQYVSHTYATDAQTPRQTPGRPVSSETESVIVDTVGINVCIN